ncbi:hypothetical protein ST47_g9191 [Ascochyta rabiei]|uniref:Uncharacterized protein n=1 Tax=Didymella rabiei TaxID=5454 RepID=A0A162Y7P6_DIDRA|nr:hypothetical protein ST47_g9191 [Ascochyta rabiei]
MFTCATPGDAAARKHLYAPANAAGQEAPANDPSPLDDDEASLRRLLPLGARTCQGNHDCRLQRVSCGSTARSLSWLFKACKATCFLCADEDTLAGDQRRTPVAACVGFTLTGDAPKVSFEQAGTRALDSQLPACQPSSAFLAARWPASQALVAVGGYGMTVRETGGDGEGAPLRKLRATTRAGNIKRVLRVLRVPGWSPPAALSKTPAIHDAGRNTPRLAGVPCLPRL